MASHKRLISGKPFNEQLNEEEFNKYYKSSFQFDEDGFITECPACSGCGKGFIDPKIPDQNTKTGKIELSLAKLRFKERLEKHIQNEVDIELSKIRIEIQKKIREKYNYTKQQSSEESSTASSID